MKVRMRVGISGTIDGQDWPAVGGEIEVSNVEGADMCARGLAEPVAKSGAGDAEKRPAKKAEKR
jgi:hypothetical protein